MSETTIISSTEKQLLNTKSEARYQKTLEALCSAKPLPKRESGKIKSQAEILIFAPDKTKDDGFVFGIADNPATVFAGKFSQINGDWRPAALSLDKTAQGYQERPLPTITRFLNHQQIEAARVSFEKNGKSSIPLYDSLMGILPDDLPENIKDNIDSFWGLDVIGPDEQGRYKIGSKKDLDYDQLPADKKIGTISIVRYQTDTGPGFFVFGKNYADLQPSPTDKKIIFAKQEAIQTAFSQKQEMLLQAAKEQTDRFHYLSLLLRRKADEEISWIIQNNRSKIDPLLAPVTPVDGVTAYQKDFSQFYQDKKPINKFAYWIISGWHSIYGKENFDPLALGITYSLRHELGLTDELLPEMDPNTTASVAVSEKIRKIKPIIDSIEKQILPLLPDSQAVRDPNRHNFSLGQNVGELVRHGYKNYYLARSDQFATSQESQQQTFEQLVAGEYDGESRNKIAQRAYRTLYAVSHLRRHLTEQDEQKLPQFTRKAEALSHKLNKLGFKSFRLIQKAMSSPEGVSIFKPIQGDNPLKKLIKSAGLGMTLAEGYRLWSELTDNPIHRAAQMGILGTGFIFGRSNLLKDIRWSQAFKTVLRGGSSLGLMYLTNVALTHTGIIPDVNMLGKITLQATLAKMIASNVLGTLGLNLTSESLINRIYHHKQHADRLSEYLFFQEKSPERAQLIFQKEMRKKKPADWTKVVYFLSDQLKSPQEWLIAGKSLTDIQENLMALMIHNPTRYQLRQVTDAGQTYMIDNRQIVKQIIDLKKQLYQTALHHSLGNQSEQLLDLLEDQQKIPLSKRLRQKVTKARVGTLLSTTTVNSIFLIGSQLKTIADVYSDQYPWLKKVVDEIQKPIDLIFGKAESVTAPIKIESPTIRSSGEQFIYKDDLPFGQTTQEVNARMDDLFGVIQVAKDQNTDPFLEQAIMAENHIDQHQINALVQSLKTNQMTIEDLRVYLKTVQALAISDDPFTLTLAKSLDHTNQADVGKLAEAVSALSQNLRPLLAQSVADHPVLAKNLYAFANFDGQPLLDRLGIDTHSIEFQLGLTQISDEMTNKIVTADVGVWNEGNFYVFKNHGWYFIGQLQPLTHYEDWQTFEINILKTEFLSQDKDLTQALSNPGYSHFIGQVYKAYIRTEGGVLNGDGFFKTIADNLDKDNPDFASRFSYLQEIYQLVAPRLGVKKTADLILDAAKGDPRAFNRLHQAITAEYPGQIENLFPPSSESFTNLQRVLNYSRQVLPQRLDVKNTLIEGLNSYGQELQLSDPTDQFSPVWPAAFFEPSSVSEQRYNLINILNGEAPLDKALSHNLGLMKLLFTNQGKIVGQYANAYFTPRDHLPERLVDFAANIEGPLHPDADSFLKVLFGRNLKVLANPILEKLGKDLGEVDYSGASDPAMQLAKSLLAQQMPENHKLYYTADYLIRLVVSAKLGHFPQELSHFVSDQATSLDPTLPKETILGRLLSFRQSDMAADQPINNHLDQWKEIFTSPTRSTESFSHFNFPQAQIDDLCAKLEQYLLAQRLIKVYGAETIYKDYLNYVYLGNIQGVPIYGMEAGSQVFFGKSLEQLNDGESLMLVSLIQQPNGYSPLPRILTAQEVASGLKSPDEILRRVGLNRVDLLTDKGILDPHQAQTVRLQIMTAQFTNQPPEALNNHIPDEVQIPLAKILSPPNPELSDQPTLGTIDFTEPQVITVTHPGEMVNNIIEINQQLSLQEPATQYLSSMLEMSKTFEDLSQPIQNPHTIDEFSRDLKILINSAKSQNLYGDQLGDFLTRELKRLGVVIDTKEASDSIRMFAASTVSPDGVPNPGDCLRADQLLTGLNFNGAGHVQDIGGWNVVDAKQLAQNIFHSAQESISYGGAKIFKFHDLIQLEIGDHIVVDNPTEPGHIAVVIKKGIDDLGRPTIQIFDVNADRAGSARIINLNDSNFSNQLTGNFQAAIIRKLSTGQESVEIPANPIAASSKVFSFKIDNPEIPINSTDVPIFQVMDSQGEITHYPGVALSIYDSTGHQLAQVNPTGILGSVPIMPGSTIKPFIYAFLRSKGIDPNLQLPNQPGFFHLDQYGARLPIINPPSYPELNSQGEDNIMNLRQALAVSTNVVFQKQVFEMQENNPETWIELQNFLRKFGLEMTDIYGNELRQPTAAAAIGSDAYVRSLNHLAKAYAILANGEDFFKNDPNLVKILNETKEVLMNDQLKQTPTPNGFTLNDFTLALHDSNCNGIPQSCGFKTGTVGGTFIDPQTGQSYGATTRVLTAGFIKKDGKFLSAVALEAGQEYGSDGNPREMNLEKITNSAYGSMMVLPWLRTLLEKLAGLAPVAQINQ